MAGIAGIACQGRQAEVAAMLQKVAHRGGAGWAVFESEHTTLGTAWTDLEASQIGAQSYLPSVADGKRFSAPIDPAELNNTTLPFAVAAETGSGIFLARSLFGVRPLYYGACPSGDLVFASEVKALLPVTHDIHEFPTGSWYTPADGFQRFASIEVQPARPWTVEEAAQGLRARLDEAVRRRIDSDPVGSWLSGGLDSSAIVALARPYARELYTFAGGLAGAPDLENARQAADFLHTRHQEVVLTVDDLWQALPDVIYAMESFDALLIRSTVMNYMVAKRAKDWVGSVFSGEGGDELFAGYAYLDSIPTADLPGELIDITRRLHNTALQRVDRSASAHGLIPHVPFLDREVAEYVFQIPVEYKRGPEEHPVEKWILRKALEGLLPEAILWRKKAKFWEGAGVGDHLSRRAEELISDADFARERVLPNGWELNTKEELHYYRLFKDCFGEIENLDWMGRTKGSPRQEIYE